MTSGYEHYFEEEGMVIAGRPVEIIVEDSEGNPSVGLDKLKKLIERENVDIVAGPVSSGVAYGIADYIKQADVPIFITQATANGLTQGDRAPNIFRTAFSSDQLHLPMGEYFVNDVRLQQSHGLGVGLRGRPRAPDRLQEFPKPGGRGNGPGVVPPLGRD